MQLEGITWHAITLQADHFGATKKLLIPEAIPDYGFNDGGIVFGFRVEDIEAASEELAEAGCELLGEITRIEQMNYAIATSGAPTDASTGSTSTRTSPG